MGWEPAARRTGSYDVEVAGRYPRPRYFHTVSVISAGTRAAAHAPSRRGLREPTRSTRTAGSRKAFEGFTPIASPPISPPRRASVVEPVSKARNVSHIVASTITSDGRSAMFV